MKTFEKLLKSILLTILFSSTFIPKTYAQTPADSTCAECLNFNIASMYLTNLAIISYRAEVDGYVGNNRSNYVEIYINDSLVFEDGYDFAGLDNSYTYSYGFDATPYYGDSLNIKVLEKRTTDGTPGALYKTTIRKDKLVLVTKDQTDQFAAVSNLSYNSCRENGLTSFETPPTINAIKQTTQEVSKIQTVEKGKDISILLSFPSFLGIDRVTWETFGGSEYDGTVNQAPVIPLPGFVFFDRTAVTALNFENISFDPEFNHCYPVLFKLYKGNQLIKSVVMPVLVTGQELDLSEGKTTWSAPIPNMILHNPIGDGSSTFMQQDTSTCSQVTNSLTQDGSQNAFLEVKVGVAGDVAGVPFEAYGSAGTSVTTKQGTSTEVINEVCIKDVQEIEIENDPDALPIYSGTDGDLFIGMFTEYYYGPALKISHANCGIQVQGGVGLQRKNVRPFAKRKVDIEAQLRFIRSELANNSGLSDQERRTMENDSSAWRQMIDKNDTYVLSALTNGSGRIWDVSKGLNQSFNQGVTRNQSFSMQTKLFVENEVFTKAGAEVAGSGFSAGGGLSFSNEVSNGNQQSSDYSRITGFKLLENEESDRLQIEVIEDKRFGSYIFKLIPENSATSCPYIGGYQLNQPQLFVNQDGSDKKTVNIYTPLGSAAEIPLKIGNASNSTRTYRLSAGNLANASVELGANGIGLNEQNKDYTLEQNESIILESGSGLDLLYVKQNPNDPNQTAYEGIEIILSPTCVEPASFTDTVILNVYFGEIPPVEGTGLTGTYFNSTELTNQVLSRLDSTINFDWGLGSPDPSINPDFFSTRWEGEIMADQTDIYTFYTNTDDGVRLWVNDVLLIDQWVNQQPTEVSGNIELERGKKVSIKMEYYEYGGEAVVQLMWENSTVPKQIIPKKNLFPTSVSTSISNIPLELQGAKLQQNYPNPASIDTNIPLEIPLNTQRAQLQIMNLNGQIVENYPIKEKGSLSINVSTEELNPGFWMYRLILDGFVIGTKKMVVVK